MPRSPVMLRAIDAYTRTPLAPMARPRPAVVPPDARPARSNAVQPTETSPPAPSALRRVLDALQAQAVAATPGDPPGEAGFEEDPTSGIGRHLDVTI
jgi:hypothetical protein